MTIIRDIRVRQVKCGAKMAHELTYKVSKKCSS
jgi:hypothetical protein